MPQDDPKVPDFKEIGVSFHTNTLSAVPQHEGEIKLGSNFDNLGVHFANAKNSPAIGPMMCNTPLFTPPMKPEIALKNKMPMQPIELPESEIPVKAHDEAPHTPIPCHAEFPSLGVSIGSLHATPKQTPTPAK